MKKYLIIFSICILAISNGKAQHKRNGLCSTEMQGFFNQNIDTIPGRGVANNYLLWDNGATISVKFMPGGSENLRNQVIKYAKIWEQYANIKFNFLPDNALLSQIRIKLTDNDGAWSLIGTNANLISQREPTLNLDTVSFLQISGPAYWQATVIHEFGHALGLLHEQAYPGSIRWNKEALYKYYLETNNWDKDQVDFNVLKVFDQFYTNGTVYDPKSVMHYSVQKWQNLDNLEIPPNLEISAGDKMLIGYLYPKSGPRQKEVPRAPDFKVSQTFEIVNNVVLQRLVIYPVFSIETNEMMNAIWWVARFYDENGNPILTDKEEYNQNGVVGTWNKLTLIPKNRVNFNVNNQRNFWLSLPVSEISGYKGKKILVTLTAYLRDEVQNKFVDIYQSDPVAYSMPSK